MQMSLEEFETKFFEPERVKTYIENRTSWIEEYKASSETSKWTTYFMLLGSLAAHGRITVTEYQKLGPDMYSQKVIPTPERLYTLTALVDLIKQ